MGITVPVPSPDVKEIGSGDHVTALDVAPAGMMNIMLSGQLITTAELTWSTKKKYEYSN